MSNYDEELLNRIREYVRQNMGTYTPEALRDRLIRDGAPAEAVDRVISETRGSPYYGPPPVPMPPASPARPLRASIVLLVITAGIVVNLAVAAGALFLAIQFNSALPWILCPLAVAAEIAGAIAYGRKSPSVTVGLVVGLVLTPIVAVVLLLGACIAIIYAMGGSIAG